MFLNLAAGTRNVYGALEAVDEIAGLKVELGHKEKAEEAYKNQVEESKAQLQDLQNEYKLTVETYEKSLKERKDTFTRINKWMSRVAGMDEKVNPNEKAARIEKLVLERWDILEENKKLKESDYERTRKKEVDAGSFSTNRNGMCCRIVCG